MTRTGLLHAIDFGTSNSTIIVGRPDGMLQRVADPASPAESHSIPTSVCVLRNGQIAVGRAAENAKKLRPGAYRSEFKRDFGDPTPTMLAGRPMTADDLTAEVLRFLREQAQRTVPEDPERVVITVPASWEAGNQELMRRAARQAGYGTAAVELKAEPIAALAYAFSEYHDAAQPITVFVYDLGGGTFDCAIARGTSGQYQVLGRPGGLDDVGGTAFDRLLIALIRERFGDAAAALLDGPAHDPETLRRRLSLKDVCETFKCQLSATGYHEDLLTELSPPSFLSLDRTEFEALIRPLLADTISECDRLLAELGLGWPDVHRIVPVGGSSKIPLVGKLLAQHSGRPVLHIDRPDLAIAHGAALIGCSPQGRNHMAKDTAPGSHQSATASGRADPDALLETLHEDVVQSFTRISALLEYADMLDINWSGDKTGTLQAAARIREHADSVRRLELVMPIVAPMKAGKSTLINAIVGYPLLPARANPMTTLPTRIKLVDGLGLEKPELAIPDSTIAVFNRIAAQIRKNMTGDGWTVPEGHSYLAGLAASIDSGHAEPLRSSYQGGPAIWDILVRLNDQLRLAVLATGESFVSDIRELPEITTGHRSTFGTPAPAGGQLVIVDTPGPNEHAMSAQLGPTLETQLQSSHVVLVVLDYTQMGADAAAEIKDRLQSQLEVITSSKIFAVVNKVDERRKGDDLNQEQTRAAVRAAFGLTEAQAQTQIFETVARWGLIGAQMLGDIEQLGEHLVPAESESAAALLKEVQPYTIAPEHVAASGGVMLESTQPNRAFSAVGF